jgi:hypothetical protein
MLVLLAGLPYLVAIIANWLTVGQIFRPGESSQPQPGVWSAFRLAPIAIGGLTPIALLARKGVSSSDRGLLALAAVLAVAFSVIALVAFADTNRALRLQRPVRISGHSWSWLLGWRLILILGSLLLGFAAVSNIIVAGN